MVEKKKIVIFVHGWSVHNTDTYGEFPDRLEQEAGQVANLDIDIRHIWLGKYVSFRDEIQMEDISRAFDAELHQQLQAEIDAGQRFVCITHSTGGPVIRDWLQRFYGRHNKMAHCPLSHLIMLAPANFGSALAQLGKARVSRLKSWFDGVEPGTGVLDWLELGSPEAWKLNKDWLNFPDLAGGGQLPFLFVLTGQQIDRSLYDYANSYTGETGSDGVVRVAAANLNTTYICLQQQEPADDIANQQPPYPPSKLVLVEKKKSRRTAFVLIKGRSHSGEKMGIIRSIKNNNKPHPTVAAVLKCLLVDNTEDYSKLCDRFDSQNVTVMKQELLERDKHLIRPDSYYIHDPYSMVIIRVRDDKGFVVKDVDIILTGKNHNPERLPHGFLQDNQRNNRHHGTLTLFLNHTLMTGCPEIKNKKGKTIRPHRSDAQQLGFKIIPHETTGMVHYQEAELQASKKQLVNFLQPNQTTVVDIVLRRIVHSGVFCLTQDRSAHDFKDDAPGSIIDE